MSIEIYLLNYKQFKFAVNEAEIECDKNVTKIKQSHSLSVSLLI